MITYRAMLDVPRALAQYVGRLLRAERRERGTRRRSRVLTCFQQAVFGLRWFRDNRDIPALARDHGISRATGYRYLEEVISVLAAQAPDLHETLQRAKDGGASHVILDGKLFSSDRLSEKTTHRGFIVVQPPCGDQRLLELSLEPGQPGREPRQAGSDEPGGHRTAEQFREHLGGPLHTDMPAISDMRGERPDVRAITDRPGYPGRARCLGDVPGRAAPPHQIELDLLDLDRRDIPLLHRSEPLTHRAHPQVLATGRALRRLDRHDVIHLRGQLQARTRMPFLPTGFAILGPFPLRVHLTPLGFRRNRIG